MCGVYYIDLDKLSDKLLAEITLQGEERGRHVFHPGDLALVVLKNGDGYTTGAMRWGFSGRGGRIINARVESIHDKPTFSALAMRQRCVMPASGYFEWRKSDRQKFRISPGNGGLSYLAGLYRMGEAGMEFVVVTQKPVGKVGGVHNRQPLMLTNKSELSAWLNGSDVLFSQENYLSVEAEGDEQLSMF